MEFDAVQAAIEAAANHEDHSVAEEGGGDYAPPPEGPVRLRMSKYIELGTVNDTFKGQPKKNDKVYIAFQLFGKNYPPQEDGRPQEIGFTINYGLYENSAFFKLFNKLNHDQKAKIFAQLVGDAFMGDVVHKKTDTRTYANLRNDDGFTIRPPFIDKMDEDGEVVRQPVKVPELVGEPMVFLWKYATKEMWDSLFIDGHWPDKKDKSGVVTQEGKSKNYFQNTIMAAINFDGSPIQQILAQGGDLDLGDAEKPARGKNKDKDPLEEDDEIPY